MLLRGLLIVAYSASVAYAQDSGAAVVRLRSPMARGEQMFAVVPPWMADTLALQPLSRRFRPAGPVVRLPRSAISVLHVSTRRTRPEGMRVGALLGASGGALGGVAAGLFAAALGGEYYPRGTDKPGVHPMFFTVPVTAALGATAGALGGAALPGRRWRRVDQLSWQPTQETCVSARRSPGVC